MKKFIDTADWIRLPGYRLVQPAVERITGIDRINGIYRKVRRDGMSAAAFCAAALDELGASMEIHTPADFAPCDNTSPLLVLANHPTGFLEALMLAGILESLRPAQWKLLSNKFVAAAPEFSQVAVPMDAFGLDRDPNVNRRGLLAALRHLREGGCLGAFPAGRVAPANGPDGLPCDSAWSPHLVRLARHTGARVVIVRFPLTSGWPLRAIPLGFPQLRALLLSREALRRRPMPVAIRLIDVAELPGDSDTMTARRLHHLCHAPTT